MVEKVAEKNRVEDLFKSRMHKIVPQAVIDILSINKKIALAKGIVETDGSKMKIDGEPVPKEVIAELWYEMYVRFQIEKDVYLNKHFSKISSALLKLGYDRTKKDFVPIDSGNGFEMDVLRVIMFKSALQNMGSGGAQPNMDDPKWQLEAVCQNLSRMVQGGAMTMEEACKGIEEGGVMLGVGPKDVKLFLDNFKKIEGEKIREARGQKKEIPPEILDDDGVIDIDDDLVHTEAVEHVTKVMDERMRDISNARVIEEVGPEVEEETEPEEDTEEEEEELPLPVRKAQPVSRPAEPAQKSVEEEDLNHKISRLHFGEMMTIAEIADELDMTSGQISGKLHKIKKREGLQKIAGEKRIETKERLKGWYDDKYGKA